MSNTPFEVSNFLGRIYETRFRGTRSGRYQLSREAMRQLAGRERLHDSFVEQVKTELAEDGIVLVCLDDCFVVVKEAALLNCRKLPDRLLERFAGDEPEDEDEEEIDEETEEEG